MTGWFLYMFEEYLVASQYNLACDSSKVPLNAIRGANWPRISKKG